MATTKFLVYWIEETTWSVVSKSALRDDVLPGQRTFTKFQGKWYPSLVIAKDDQKNIDKAEKSFGIFMRNCFLEESPEDVENCILQYIHALPTKPKVVEVQSIVAQSPSSSSDLASCSSTLIPSLPTKPKVVEVQSPVEQSPSSSSSSLIPLVTRGNTSTEYPDSPVSILRETKSERRIRKLEDEVKYMKRKIRKLEEKDQDTIVIKKFDLDNRKKEDLITGKKVDLTTEKKVDTAVIIDTFDETKSEIKKSIDLVEGKIYDELKVNSMKTDKEKLKYLVGSFFTNEELKNNSRTGKKSPKSVGSGARPPLNGETFQQLTDAVVQHTNFDVGTFIKKFENMQKVLRR